MHPSPSPQFARNEARPPAGALQAARQLRSCKSAPRRTLFRVKACAIMMSLAASHAFAQTPASAPASGAAGGPVVSSSGGLVYDLLIGTYTGSGKSEGIYVYRFDTGNGELMRIASAQTVNPSYLVVSRDRHYVYAVNELPGDNGPASQRGGISAFRFDRASGQLSFTAYRRKATIPAIWRSRLTASIC